MVTHPVPMVNATVRDSEGNILEKDNRLRGIKMLIGGSPISKGLAKNLT